jgi:hypothetical protein
VVLACKPGPSSILAIIKEKEDGKSNPKWTSIIWVSERVRSMTELPKEEINKNFGFAI